MVSLQQPIDRQASAIDRDQFPLLPVAAIGLILVFLAAPWPLDHKAHLLLHGLCAQRPSHSFWLGDRVLPFDARMTGIYGGFLGAGIYLAIKHRWRAAALPPWTTLLVLAGFVGLMGADGINSFLVDAGGWHLYTPDNRLRLLTGLMTGVALATALAFLIGITVWRQPVLSRRVVASAWEPWLMLGCQAPLALAVLSGSSWLYVPITLALVVSATVVISLLALVVVVLVRDADHAFTSVRQLHGYGTVALLAGVLVMMGFAVARLVLERLLNVPPLT
jgi:uncharacterized membrane protein